MSIEFRILRAGEAAVLDRVAEGVFDNAVQPALAREFLDDARHHLAVALDDGVVVGFASGVHYVHPDKPAEQHCSNATLRVGRRRPRRARARHVRLQTVVRSKKKAAHAGVRLVVSRGR